MADFYNCEVKVVGPGQTFADVMIVVRRALIDAGYVVEVEDEYPIKNTMEDIELARMKKFEKRYPIKLTAKHCPWGG